MKYETLKERFWKYVDCSDNESCWSWEGYIRPNGYGEYRHSYSDFKSKYAHRIAFFLTYGEFNTDFEVCHKCDNPSCVNPSHLFLGTHSDNMRDMVNKGRHGFQVDSSNCPLRKPFKRVSGENNGQAKLTMEKVKEIREKHAIGEASIRKLALDYSVGRSTIKRVLNNKTWNEDGGM